MHRPIITLAALALVIAACGTDAAPDGSTTTSAATDAGGSTTTTASTTPSTTAPSDGTASTTSTTDTTASTTTTTRGQGPAEFALTQVVFGDLAYVVITNIGLGPGTLEGHWLCQRPSYFEIPPIELGAGEKVAIALGTEKADPLGVVATIDGARALGFIRPEDGEVALFASPSFDDPEQIVDYVEWGAPDHGRSAVAVAAGIWPEGGFVETQPEALAISVVTVPANAPEDWFGDIGG